jgi:transposase InsO family protein
MSYPLIYLLQQKAIPGQQSCRVLEVSRSGFLVCTALHMVIQQRQPEPGEPGLIVHSDRGSQYACGQYQALLAKHGFVCKA